MRAFRLLASASLWVALVCSASWALGADGNAPKRNPAFGMHIHRLGVTPWPEPAFGAWRLWDARVSWKNMEPRRGSIDFSKLDEIVGVAERNGVELNYVFGVTPAWASARPDEPGAYGPGSAAEPANREDWRAFVRAVATRYKGRIRTYEVWNEPNWKNFYTGTWAQLADLVKDVADTVREVDPSATIVLPALASEHGLSVLGQFLATGVGRYVDVIAYHFYTGHKPPEQMLGMVATLKRLMRENGLEAKPIWNTEFGWLVEGAGRTIDPAAVGFAKSAKVYTDAEAAAFVVRAYVIMASEGVERSYFYAWDNESMGAYDPKTRRLKPQMSAAFDTVGRWLGGRRPSCKGFAGAYSCQLSAEIAEGAIVWVDQGTLDLQSYRGKWSTAEDIAGNKVNLATGVDNLPRGTGPFLLRK